MSALALLGVIAALHAATGLGPVAQPDYRAMDRHVLAAPAPHGFGHGRIVSQRHASAPRYVIPYHRIRRNVGPSSYSYEHARGGGGEHGWGYDARYHGRHDYHYQNFDHPYAHARVGETIVAFDPFAPLRSTDLAEFRVARNLWLIEHGYVRRARVLARPNTGLHSPGMSGVSYHADYKRPEPRAILKVEPAPRRRNRDSELEVRRPYPGKVIITSRSRRDADDRNTLAAKLSDDH